MNYTLEICTGSVHSVRAAIEGGADRIELCDNLAEGGTTPSFGMIKTCLSMTDIPVFPIIRPRSGDFVYSEEEFGIMKQDVICCRDLGCRGAVLGILLKDYRVDEKRCAELIALAGNMELTFHRAFDCCADMKTGLESIIDLGFKRILTSGGAAKAEDALSVLKGLVLQANGRVSIMPGSGITVENLKKIILETGASEFHSTAKEKKDMVLNEAHERIIGEYYSYETAGEKVRAMKGILQS